MTYISKRLALTFFFAGIFAAQASYLDDIGVTLLRATTTNLNGSGIRVAQPEADDPGTSPGTNTWEVRGGAVGQSTNLFTYYNGAPPLNSSGSFPNLLGLESGHAEFVAGYFYGMTNTAGFNGVATNVSHVDNYQADSFISYYIIPGISIPSRIVNQSYTFGVYSTTDDQYFDNYAAQRNVLFLSGVAGPPIFSPASCYNGIAVGSFWSPVGPTSDGRCKPDIIAPGFAETSYTTPQVSGAAAILLQAGLRGDGGGDTNSATDIRTLKALLLNGAVKPANWTNSNSSPLDARYGAGVVNIFNSYKQLCGGKRTNFLSATIGSGNSHLPVAATNTISVLNGWDFETITSSAISDAVNHYFFNVTNADSAPFMAVVTLVWNKHAGQSSINNLELFLYNCANSNLVTCSTSVADNVQHVFVPQLAPGRYDLQVWKAATTNVLLFSEPYALAFEFASPTIAISKSGTNVNLTWPIYPAGFAIAATTDLTAQNWSTNHFPSPAITDNQNVISIPATNAVQFFRLQTPNF